MRDRVAFLHIPKSAGTSLRHSFGQHYDPTNTVPWSLDSILFGHHESVAPVQHAILPDETPDYSSASFMHGHFALPTIRRWFAPADVALIIREPRSRLLSHYSYWRSWSPEVHDRWLPYEASRSALQSLADFCQDDNVAHQVDNLSARLIIGPHPLIPADALIRPEHHEELRALGVSRLKELGFVDILERGGATLDALDTWFGSQLERLRLNETDLEGGPALVVAELEDPVAQQLLLERTDIDEALWMYAAMRAGISESDAAALCKSAFESSLQRLVSFAGSQHGAAHTNGASDAVPAEEDLRLLALVKRRTWAVAARTRDEIRRRRPSPGA